MPHTTVADLMTESPQTVGRYQSLVHAFDVMASLQCRHVPVVDDDGALVGMVSERDLLRHAIGARDVPITTLRAHLEERSVETVMVTGIETAYADDPINEAASKMLENKFGCLPIIEGRRVVGILTEADFVRQVAMEADR